MLKHFAILSAALLVGACATGPTSSTEPVPEKVYRTGSNLPARDGGVTMTPEEVERARNAATANMGRGKGN
jgi:hypothetical protein